MLRTLELGCLMFLKNDLFLIHCLVLQVVKTLGFLSKQRSSGVPHGAIMGPLLFNIYTFPLTDIKKYNNISQHLYA